MVGQRTFASSAWTQKGKVTRWERVLAEMDAVTPWARLLTLIAPLLSAGRARPAAAGAGEDAADREGHPSPEGSLMP